jgi:hypothetical protein
LGGCLVTAADVLKAHRLALELPAGHLVAHFDMILAENQTKDS